jgi:hypothetical protein
MKPFAEEVRKKRKYSKRIPYNPNNRICPGKIYRREVVQAQLRGEG